MKRPLRLTLCFLLGIPLCATLPVPFLGTMWHLVHGDFVVYRQWQIRVPPTFYVRQGAHGPLLWRLTFGFPVWHTPYAVIGVSDLPHPFKYEEDYLKFMTGADLAAQDQGYKFLSTRKVSVGKVSGYCYEYGLLQDSSKSFVQCAVEGTVLLFGYRGHTKYIPILLSTVQSITYRQEDPSKSQKLQGR